MTAKTKRYPRLIPSERTLLFWGLASVIFLVVYGLRAYHLHTAFDIFIDEITYVRLAESVQLNGWASLYGQPFHLHPPGFFFLEAFYLNLIPPSAGLFDQIYAVRYLNVLLAGGTAVSLFALVRRLSNTLWGLFAALLFAADAFIIRMNSMNLLDTVALFWVTVGYTVLIIGSDDERKPLSPITAILTGVLFGLGLLTKDMTAFLTIAVMGGLLVTGWFLRRRDTLLIIAITGLMYSLYIAAVIAVGEWTTFYNEKLSGVLRFAGFSQQTGVNRAQGPSLIDKILEKLSEFGMTYLLIALGVLGIFILLKWGRRRQRIIAVWAIGAYALLTYSTLFGTLEEQFFYFLVVPCVVVVSLAFSNWIAPVVKAQYKTLVILFLMVFTLLFGVVSGREWFIRHSQPDDAFERMVAYIQEHIPEPDSVASSSETGQFLLETYTSAPWGVWYSVNDLLEEKPPFVLLSYDQLAWDHGDLALPLIEWVQTHGTKKFEVAYRSNHLVLFELNYR